MFRPLRRTKRAISDEAAKDLLLKERRGIFAVNGDDGYPYALPVNYYYDPETNKIYFHGARVGHKIDALKKSDKVCFTVYGNERIEADCAWAPYVQSVIAFGRCGLISDAGETETRVRTLAGKYYPSKEEIEAEIRKDIAAVQLYEITIEHLTGKEIRES